MLMKVVLSEVDGWAQSQGVERVKTMGDGYRVAAGLPNAGQDHAAALTDMAIEMMRATEQHCAQTGHDLHLRIGLHSGPVVAGVIGNLRPSYDVWGDTINVASRMEATSTPGRIQITEELRALLDSRFQVEARGAVEVKGKGRIVTYFVDAATKDRRP